MVNNVKLPAKLRGCPPHMFANWSQHAEPPNDVPVAPPNLLVWRHYEPQRATDAVGQPSTVQAAAGAPVAVPSDPEPREDDETQFQGGSSANPIPPSHEQRAEGVELSQNPPLDFYVNGAPITPTDDASLWLSPNLPPAAIPYSSHAPLTPLDALHSSRYRPDCPPRPGPRHASHQATQWAETHASTSRVHGADAAHYPSHSDVLPQGSAHDSDPQVHPTSPSDLYSRLSVDAATGAYCWVGTMNLATLDDPAVRTEPSRHVPLLEHLPQPGQFPPFGYRPPLPQDASFHRRTEPSRFAADVPLSDYLPHQPGQFPPLGYPDVVPQNMLIFGQNDAVGPSQLYSQEDEDVSMDDQQDPYREENAYFHGGVPDIPLPDHLSHQHAQIPPFGYPNVVPILSHPNVLPRDIPVLGQNDAVGHSRPYPPEDVAMDDQEDLHHEGDGYPYWGISASGSQEGRNTNLPNGPVAGPSTNHHEPLAADPGLLNAPWHAEFPPPGGWPLPPQDENPQPPSGYQGHW
ncbi:hypothetical protein GSI_13131 [Ganoderma sinense ZZ0214-1]|uniref:Uncharacterized protein n=1 Tax=Ganoderma sinense ZZ0214-1 TaxID=1077348 RepID=A0A2G8RUP9_9APHY|nr:hypothetical protein GSI_13131 [Ganoderma sinense ZZ0214-1]